MTRSTVTVITVTRGRPQLLLERAVRSVAAQETSVSLTHLIIADDCLKTFETATSLSAEGRTAVLERREPGECSGPSRLGRLRNVGVRLAESDLVCFLDDDNEWEADHIETLFQCLERTGADAVYSDMQLLDRHGRPYLDEVWPWRDDPEVARAEYARRVKKGAVEPGSNVVRELIEPAGVVDPVQSVDAGEWLFLREVLLASPFPESFTLAETRDRVGDDDKLLQGLLAKSYRLHPTRRATLRYYLGGYSNCVEARDDTFEWQRQ